MTNDEDETIMKLYEKDEDDGFDDENAFPLHGNAFLGIMHYATVRNNDFGGGGVNYSTKINSDFLNSFFVLI